MRRTVLALGLSAAWILAAAGCSETRSSEPEAQREDDPIPPISPLAPRPAPMMSTPAQPPAAKPAEAPSEPEPRMPVDAGATPMTEDDAGEPDAATPDAGPSEPVPCSPMRQPLSRELCTMEGQICSNWSTDSQTGYDTYQACMCVAASSTELVWDCYESESGQLQCPHQKPANATSCFGFKGQTCPYPPRIRCECPVEPGQDTWRCAEPPVAPVAPAALPTMKPVRELTDAERQAFCTWYVDATIPDGFPLPPNAEPDAEGFFPDTGCSGCGGSIANDAMIPQRLPTTACVANLSLSQCELPLSELIDCVRSLLGACWPSPRGCARYLEAPNCSGTIATRYNNSASDGATDCRVRVRAP